MCNWGESEEVLVFIPSWLSYTHKDRFAFKKIDKCIAPIVKALNFNGIYTTQSCCGHGKGDGRIDLLDGRTLILVPSKQSQSSVNTETFGENRT